MPTGAGSFAGAAKLFLFVVLSMLVYAFINRLAGGALPRLGG